MTLFDVAAVVLVLGYALLGLASGLIRRVLGLIGVYVGAVVATHAGISGAAILRQEFPALSVADSRAYTWFFVFLLLVAVIELMAGLVHHEIQISVVALNRASGVLVGVVTALVIVTTWAYMLGGLSQASGPDFGSLEAQTRDALTGSKVGLPLARWAAPVVLPPLYAALPRDPSYYFVQPSG